MIALKQFEQQIRFAFEVRIERAARISGCGRDIFDARCNETLRRKDIARCIQQTFARLLLSLLSGQALQFHWRKISLECAARC
ncbi:hypothetical protein [Paraburkholderia sp. LEh10]|uniref:hypothetical protein n=1 Tax=Paraburkholderia sp. LEh10 TaxID=2821353 RepID=UPI0028B0D377|nr:hypothetical protein [Paraburkholderia sp. LEh10]